MTKYSTENIQVELVSGTKLKNPIPFCKQSCKVSRYLLKRLAKVQVRDNESRNIVT